MSKSGFRLRFLVVVVFAEAVVLLLHVLFFTRTFEIKDKIVQLPIPPTSEGLKPFDILRTDFHFHYLVHKRTYNLQKSSIFNILISQIMNTSLCVIVSSTTNIVMQNIVMTLEKYPHHFAYELKKPSNTKTFESPYTL